MVKSIRTDLLESAFGVLTDSKELMLQKGRQVALQNFRKTQKLYRDFPFLWGIESRRDEDLEVYVQRLDSNIISAMTSPGTRWWVHFKHPGILEEIREVTQVAGHNLASEILLELGNLASDIEIEHLISREDSFGFGLFITIHRPRNEYMIRAPILAECRNRARKYGS